MASNPSLAQWALSYAEKHGLAVFPLAPKSKKPLISKEDGGNGCLDATCDPAQVRAWWRETPQANIGIATGRADGKLSVVVLDVDIRHGATIDAAAALCGGTLPETKRVQSGSGGWQLYFTLPDHLDDDAIRNSAGKLGQGIDIRGTGGYVVAPPSVHPDTGLRYTWHQPAVNYPFLPVPEALQEAIANAKATERGRITAAVASQPIIEGGRNDTLFRFGCKLRRDGFDDALLLEVLRATNQAKCSPPLDDEEVVRIHAQVVRYKPSRQGFLDYLADRDREVTERRAAQEQPHAPPTLPAHLTPTDAEQHLVGILLYETKYHDPSDDDLLAITSSLIQPVHVYDLTARTALAMIIQMSRQSEFLDPATVAAALTEADPGYAATLPGGYAGVLNTWMDRILDQDPDLVRSLCRTVRKAWSGRQVRRIADEQQGAIAAGDDPQAVAARTQAALDGLREEGTGDPSTDLIGNFVDDYLEQVTAWEQRGHGMLSGKSFGIRALDTLLDGMQDEELILCAGRSSMGKTAFAITTTLRLSQQCAPGHYVCIISLEMGTRAIIHRMVSILSEFSMPDIRKAWSYVDFSRVRSAAEVVRKLPILIVDARESIARTNGSGGSMSADNIWSRVKAWRRLGKLDFCVIDYLELIDANSADRREKREQQLGNTTKTLKRMAQEQRMPVMLLAQLNREGEKTINKQPSGANIRGSDQPFHVADIVVLVYRADYYLDRNQSVGTAPTEDAPPQGYTLVNVEKNRNGPAGYVECYFRKHTACFYDWDPVLRRPQGYDGASVTWFDFGQDLGQRQRAAQALQPDADGLLGVPRLALDPQVQADIFMQQRNAPLQTYLPYADDVDDSGDGSGSATPPDKYDQQPHPPQYDDAARDTISKEPENE